MTKLNWKEWLGVGVVALGVALLVVIGGLTMVQTYREHQALLNVVGYNIQQGRLVALPVGQPPAPTPAVQRAPAPAPAPGPTPPEPPKKP